MSIALIQLLAGVTALFVGGHYLVQGATRIALFARISAAVVGLTVVAMGTSLPEMAVSVEAAARGSTDLAFGNIIGSSIFNIGAILGITAIVVPVAVKRRTIRIEYPFMLVVAAVVVLLCRDLSVDRVEGAFLFFALILFTVFVVYMSRRDVEQDEAKSLEQDVRRTARFKEGKGRAWGISILMVVLGIVALIGGADLVVRGAVTIADTIGVDERVIGLTVVAMGTSLPELATSAVAALQGERDIALANVIGSNLFNLLGVLGATALVFPVPLNPAASLDNWVMLGFCVALYPLMVLGRRVSRVDGVLLLGGLCAYVTYLVLTRGV
jgi:cation:H+ antiporter